LRVFAEKRTGRTAERPELQACLDYLRPGDTLVVVSLDRLSRSLADLITLVADLRRHGGFRTCTRRWTPPRPQGASMIGWPPGGALRSKPSPDAFPLDPEPPRPRRARPYAAGRRGRRYHREPANAEEITVIDVGVVSAEVPP